MFSGSLALTSRPSDIPVSVKDNLTLDKYLSAGKQDGEVELSETEQGTSSST